MKPRGRRAFALIITLSLLALLVLAVFALSVLVRVNARLAQASWAQVQAQQNAQVALDLALADLQVKAGEDARVTGMAGITDVAPHATSHTRHWTGVWRSDGSFLGWLASGAQASAAALRAGVSAVELVGPATVGSPAANSEPVIAGRLALSDLSGRVSGAFAYVVLDEGVKTPAYSRPVEGRPPVIFAATSTSAAARLRDALVSNAAIVPRVLSYEQLAVLPNAPAPLTPSVLQDNFHHVSLGSQTVVAGALRTGMINVNTNSAPVWRNLLQTYNTGSAPSQTIAPTTLSARGTTLQNSVANFVAPGKAARGPFTSVAGVSDLFTSVFPTTGSPSGAQIYAALAPQVAVRSDTFRVRAFGESVNPLDPATTEAVAYCEAIVQRTLEPAPDGSGRRFVVVAFRWLGPGDI